MEQSWPVPLFDPEQCEGCGLCVLACAQEALAVRDGTAVVVAPAACAYDGYCAQICPCGAITHRFQILPAPSLFREDGG